MHQRPIARNPGALPRLRGRFSWNRGARPAASLWRDPVAAGRVDFVGNGLQRLLLLALALLPAASALAVTPQELLAHPPKRYFNDYAQMAQPATAAYLEGALANFERETSNQIVMVIFPEWPADLVFDDYAQDLFRAAKIGQQGKDNGVLVLLSLKEGKIRIHTGRGLEGALPDALCIRIIRDDFAPQFRLKNYDECLKQGLAAIMAAAKGEYKGTGNTVAEKNTKTRDADSWIPIVFIVILSLFVLFRVFRRRGAFFGGGPGGGFFIGGGGGGFSGGGGGGGGGGDDGFSGGGGDSGGGGASDDMN
jgi:uncharacterized protein